MSKIIKHFDLWFFLLAIFLFRIPNFYIIPGFESGFNTTQAIARAITIILFVININQIVSKKIFGRRLGFNMMLLLFFGLQTITIVYSINQLAFLSRFKDILISYLFFYLVIIYRSNIKLIIKAMILAFLFNVVFQLDLFFFQDNGFFATSGFVYQRYLDLYLASFYNNQRLYTTIYDEALIPILLYLIKDQAIKPMFGYFGVIFISLFSYLSNFRTRVLMVIFAIGSSIFTVVRSSKKVVFMVLIILVAVVYLGDKISYSHYGLSLLDRLSNEDVFSSQGSSYSRIRQIQNSIDMASNLIGVGLGNYYDYLPRNNWNRSMLSSKTDQVLDYEVNTGIHNQLFTTLAEVGYPGFIVLLIIVSLFIKDDYYALINNQKDKIPYIIAFWTVFIYGVLNPPVPMAYQISFWLFRGILY